MDAGDRACGRCGSERLCGVEIQGVYDGVLYWECLDCRWATPRNFSPGKHYEASVAYAKQHNDRYYHGDKG